MSFWNTSDGENVAQTATGEYTSQTDMEPLPDKSTVKAMIEKAQWKTAHESHERYIELTYSVIAPEQYANRKIFQKLWVKDDDPRAKDPAKKRDGALKMLGNIDSLAGGRLARNAAEPTDDDLALALTNKQLVITVKVWEMGGNSGNWVAGVAPTTKELHVPDAPAKAAGGPALFDDDDLPF